MHRLARRWLQRMPVLGPQLLRLVAMQLGLQDHFVDLHGFGLDFELGLHCGGLGRELGRFAIDEFTELKTIQLHLGPRTNWWLPR